MQSIRSLCYLPGSQPAMCDPTGAAEFLRNILPAVVNNQHEPDHPHDDAVIGSAAGRLVN